MHTGLTTQVRSSRGRKRAGIALVVTLALVGAACGSDDSNGAPEPTDASEDTGSATSAPTEPGDDGEIDTTATFRYAYYNAPGTFDPHKETTSFANVPLFVVYDRLVHLSPNGEPIPGLAESWEFGPDASTLTLNLREGVVFHDGTPFDADAAKANLDRARTMEDSSVKRDFVSVTEVTVVDERTIRLDLDPPLVVMPASLTDRAGAMVCPSSFDDADLPTRPCGAGMYRLDEAYDPGNSIAFVAFEDYWDPTAIGAARFEITFLSDAGARLSGMRTDRFDAANLEPDQIPDAEGAGLQVVKGEDFTFGIIFMNSERVEALKDERVRLAINLAIDRQGIVDGLLFGQGRPASQPFPEDYPAFDPNVAPFPYDVDRARDLMAEAGYADGFDLELSTIPSPLRERTVEAVAGQLEQIGIRVTIEVVEAAVLGAELTVDRVRDASVLAWGGRTDAGLTFEALYTDGGRANPSNFSRPEFEELYLRSLSETDLDARWEILREMSGMTVLEPHPVVVLYSPFGASGGSPQVVGLQHYVSGKVEFRGVGVASS